MAGSFEGLAIERDALTNPFLVRDEARRGEVEALFRAVAQEVAALVRCAMDLKSLTFDGQQLAEVTDIPQLVLRLLDSIAPYVSELCRRSPNPGELTLKRSTGHRKREEIFLSLDELLEPIHSLHPEHQTLFGRLGLSRLQTDTVDRASWPTPEKSSSYPPALQASDSENYPAMAPANGSHRQVVPALPAHGPSLEEVAAESAQYFETKQERPGLAQLPRPPSVPDG